MTVLTEVVKQSDDSQYSRMGFLLSIASGELCDELTELDETTIRVYLYQMGEVISWVGHGDNSRLPEALRQFAEKIQPQPGNTNEPSSAIAIDS